MNLVEVNDLTTGQKVEGGGHKAKKSILYPKPYSLISVFNGGSYWKKLKQLKSRMMANPQN